MPWTALRIGALLIAAGLGLASTPSAAAAPTRLETKACPPSAAKLGASCIVAPMELGGTSRPHDLVSVGAIILPARSEVRKEAIFILEGGPGLKASDAVEEFARDWNQLRADRDIVIFDTRGLDEKGLYCRPADAAEKVEAYAAEIFPQKLIERCLKDLEKWTDLTRYSSTIMAEDLDGLRQALGYDRISLISYSYGTRLAQEYVRLYPGRAASAVLLGPARIDGAYPSNLARETEEVFDLVISGCVHDPGCAAAYPTLLADRDEMLRRLARGGLPASVTYDGERHEVTISGAVVTAWLRSRMYSMDTAMMVPRLIHQLATGDTSVIAQSIIDSQRALYESTALGLWLSLSCPEDVAFVDLPSARARAAGTIVGESRLVEQVAACRNWPLATLRAGYIDPVKTQVPILLVTGGYDLATRPDDARIMLSGFANGDWLNIPNESHLFRADWEGCIGALAANFIQSGGWKAQPRPDTSCAARIKRPPFALPQ